MLITNIQSVSEVDHRDLLIEAIQESLQIKTHFDLFIWLQRKVQNFIPHEILISAWGDFSLGLIYFDIVSAHPMLRTKNISQSSLTPQIITLFNQWLLQDRSAMMLSTSDWSFNEKSLFKAQNASREFSSFRFNEMKSIILHGIKDNRGSHDCLYILMNRTPIPKGAKHALEILMPFIDCAFRRIDQLEHLPIESNQVQTENEPLTTREIEIMEHLREGRTNREIAELLDISTFTVKNHLQNIYEKLNAINRSQAVNKYTKLF
jgi:transcriptional regulator EpsA